MTTVTTETSVIETGRRREMDWRLNPSFVTRVAGLPFDTILGLRTPGAHGWARSVWAAQAALASSRSELLGELELAIGRVTDPNLRRTMITARRDLHNGRAARDLELLVALADGSFRATLVDYLAGRASLTERLGAGSEIMASDVRDARVWLREVARDSDFRGGIQLSSLKLDEHLDGYLASEPIEPGKRHRHIETSLLEYVYRTACKTSPFSRLTTVISSLLSEDVAAVIEGTEIRSRKVSRSQLNVAILGRLSSAIVSDAELRGRLTLRFVDVPIATNNALLTYWRRHVQVGQPAEGMVSLDPVHESRFTVSSGEALGLVHRVIGKRSVRFDELATELRSHRGDWDIEQIQEFLSVMIELGILDTPDLAIDIHSAEPVRDFAQSLLGLGHPRADELSSAIHNLAQLCSDFSVGDVPERRAILSKLRSRSTALLAGIGDGTIQPPNTVLYEDATLPDTAVVAGDAAWREVLLPDLSNVTQLLPLFDLNLIRRIVMKGYFVRRFGIGGASDDLLAFAHEFELDFFGNYSLGLMRRERFTDGVLNPLDNWFHQPELVAIDEGRRKLAEHMTHLLASGGDEVCLESDFVESMTAELPETSDRLAPWSFFLQLAGVSSGRPLAVVNRIHTGTGLLFSRFLHMFPGSVRDGLAAELRTITPTGSVLAELRGGYTTSNLNLHPTTLDFEIVCPGDSPTRPPANQIRPAELVIRHDPASDGLRLHCPRLGLDVIPVYQGFLLAMALPELQRILLNFSYLGPVSFDVWSGVQAGEGLRSFPRVRLGNTVLERRKWRIPMADWPRFEVASPLEDYYLAWQTWAARLGMPEQVFVSVPGQSKPLFVDGRSALSVQTLGIMSRGVTTPITVTEMLPAPDDLWLRGPDGNYVAELTVELNGSAKW